MPNQPSRPTAFAQTEGADVQGNLRNGDTYAL